MPVKFEWQFKYRDESNVNAVLADARRNRENAHFAGVTGGSGYLVYPAICRNDNHSRQSRRQACRRRCRSASAGQAERDGRQSPSTTDMLSFRVQTRVTRSNFGDAEIGAPVSAPMGTRASANTSGPDFTLGFEPDEIADQRSAPNEENLFLLPDRISWSKLLERTIQPFDLMSRRHPLSSTRASGLKSASRNGSSQGSCDVAGIKPPAIS
jgi:hypothetical protein